MSLHAWHIIIKLGNQCRQHLLVIGFLKIFWKVISDLSDAVTGRVPDFGIRMVHVLDHNRDHSTQFADIIDVLSHLAEGHKPCVFVPPVLLIS